MRNLLVVALTAATVVFAGACRGSDAPSASARFRAQLDDDWNYWLAQHPELATYVGIPDYDDRWTDYSPSGIDARERYVRASLDRLNGIPRDGLDPADALSYDLYRDLLETAVAGLQFGNDALPLRGVIPRNLWMPMNQLEGVQQDVPRLIASMPASTLNDYENIISRLEGVATLVHQTIALMERGLARGVSPPAIALRTLPSQVQGQIATDPRESPLLAPFSRFPETVPQADRDALARRAAAAYARSVRPAFTRLHEFLVSTYLPRARETTGADALPDGARWYAYNVRWHTTTGATPQEIHEVGLSEVERIRTRMDEVIATSGFKGSFEEFLTFLRSDSRFYYTDPGQLLTGYRDLAKRADPELARLFGRLPQTPYGVRAVPDAIAPAQTTAYYEPGSLAAGRPGYMFANTYKLDARPRWEMDALTLHEAVPGHHLQISLAQELETLPRFRRHSSYTAFVEGWALYAESLGEEMGFYADPYSQFGQLTYEMWRAVRLVVDTGLHAMGWSRDQAIEFFRANAAKTEQDIVVEVDRYLVWPGQALGYKVGQLKISELRASSARELGERFDIRDFHDTLLAEGAVPLDSLERRVRAWMDSRR